MSDNQKPKEPQRSGFLENLRAGDYGFLERTGKLFSNVGRKIVRRKACCGHYGDPGC